MSTKTILVIDDEKDIAESICDIISAVDGRKIINASTPSEAYMRSIGNKYDLIITDYKMPKTDGIDLIKGIRNQKQNAHTPVILISAFTEEALKKIGRMPNIFVIRKPFMADELLKAVQDMLSIPSSSEDRKPHFDAQIMTEFISATSQVIKILTGAEEVKVEKPYLCSRDQITSLKVDISGVVEMRTFQFQGSIVISFPKTTFLKMVSGFTKENHIEISEKNLSHAGSIMGLIYEQAKKNLGEKNTDLSLTTPQVMLGEGHKLSSYIGQFTMVFPVRTLAGEFFLVVTTVK